MHSFNSLNIKVEKREIIINILCLWPSPYSRGSVIIRKGTNTSIILSAITFYDNFANIILFQSWA